MAPKKFSDDLAIDCQIRPDDMAELAAQGYRSVLCARPDGEEPGQPSNAEMQAAAQAAGLAFLNIPVDPKNITMADVEAFSEAMEELPLPMYGYCRTGKRVASLWALSQAEEQDTDTLLDTAARAGFDLSELRHKLQMLG
ncbi:MAG: TIGR01244 family phosphatase [Sphingomonadales bacterium]|nr:TIGR01244 family phosphatase [Sphingomonadales bacterium]MBD3772683.1 TIGR01244 family phosphatase [Paracoccaceae bacterium]